VTGDAGLGQSEDLGQLGDVQPLSREQGEDPETDRITEEPERVGAQWAGAHIHASYFMDMSGPERIRGVRSPETRSRRPPVQPVAACPRSGVAPSCNRMWSSSARLPTAPCRNRPLRSLRHRQRVRRAKSATLRSRTAFAWVLPMDPRILTARQAVEQGCRTLGEATPPVLDLAAGGAAAGERDSDSEQKCDAQELAHGNSPSRGRGGPAGSQSARDSSPA